jgi:hypothetical protein
LGWRAESGSTIARVSSACLEIWRCSDVFEDRDDRALWQHVGQALPRPASFSATFELQLPPDSLASVTITLSKKTG